MNGLSALARMARGFWKPIAPAPEQKAGNRGIARLFPAAAPLAMRGGKGENRAFK
jgi:hypothetical protein